MGNFYDKCHSKARDEVNNTPLTELLTEGFYVQGINYFIFIAIRYNRYPPNRASSWWYMADYYLQVQDLACCGC